MIRLRRHGTVAAALLLACVGACRQEELEEPQELIRPVRFQQVEAAGSSRFRVFSGQAQAGVESRLSFKVSGTLQKLAIKVGDHVLPGSLIAQIDPRDYRLQVERAEAGLAQARAERENALANLNRIRQLYENNNASETDLDSALTTARVAEATIDSITKQLDLAKLQVEYCILLAPEEGAISEIPVEVNENVSAGQTIVVTTSFALPEVEVAIPELLIVQIRERDPVSVTFDAVPGVRFRGRVREVGVAASRSLSTFPVTVRLDRRDSRVRPGMAAQVRFRFGDQSRRDRIVVPPHSVGEDRQGRYVFVLQDNGDGSGEVSRRAVTIGEALSQGLEIIDGLQKGELIVTAGVSKIKDGQRVKVRREDGG